MKATEWFSPERHNQNSTHLKKLRFSNGKRIGVSIESCVKRKGTPMYVPIPEKRKLCTAKKIDPSS